VILEVLGWGEPVGDGRTNSQYCTVSAVAKFGQDEDAYVAANEYISARLGLSLGLPIPPCAFVRNERGRLGIVSMRVGPKGEKPPPANFDHFINDHRGLAIDVLVFDTWINNRDRSPQNLIYSRAGRIRPAVIDHDQALLQVWPNRGKLHLEQHRDDALPEHPFSVAVQDEAHLKASIERVRSVPRFMIERTCEEVVREKGITDIEAVAVLDFLHKRQAALEALVAPLVNPNQRSLL
jgi:hypothetical protein